MRENYLEIGVSDSFGPFVAVDDEDGEEAIEDVHTEEGQGVDGQQFGWNSPYPYLRIAPTISRWVFFLQIFYDPIEVDEAEY